MPDRFHSSPGGSRAWAAEVGGARKECDVRAFHTILVTAAMFLLLPGCASVMTQPTTESQPPEQEARDTLVAFFEDLHAGRYEEAMGLYGGTYEIMTDHNPTIDVQDHAALMRNACTINGAQCLQIRTASLDRQVSATEFVFTVEFQADDGSLFVLGPCCGASEEDQPPRSVFEITVIKTSESEYLVMDMPPYMP